MQVSNLGFEHISFLALDQRAIVTVIFQLFVIMRD